MSGATNTSYGKCRFNKKQKDWLIQYQRSSNYEPMYLDEFRNGALTWDDLMRENLVWLELHFQDMYAGADSWKTYE